MTDRTTEEAKREALIARCERDAYNLTFPFMAPTIKEQHEAAQTLMDCVAALQWQAEQQKGEAWPAELSSSNRTQPVRFAVMDDEGLWIDDDDFIFDALIKVHGDFPDDEVKGKYLAEIVRRLNAANSLPQAPQGEQWRPIETAPKDGRTILLGYFNSHGKWRTMRGQWISKEYIDEYWEDPEGVEAGWFETPVEAEDPPNCWPTDPTHWMPLPPPPLAQGDSQ